jgi:hypothetical protein
MEKIITSVPRITLFQVGRLNEENPSIHGEIMSHNPRARRVQWFHFIHIL